MQISKSARRTLAAQFNQTAHMFTPDGWTTDRYTAIKDRIEPNTPKAFTQDIGVTMQSVINSLGALRMVYVIDHKDEFVYVSDDTATLKLNRKYFDNIVKALNGYAWPRLTGGNLSPLAWIDDDNQIVALLMPLKDSGRV